MGEKVNFGDARYHAAPPKAATTAEQASLAALQAKYLQTQREAEELRRLRQTPLPQAPKGAQQQASEAYQNRRAQVLGESAAAKEFSLPKLESVARQALGEGANLVRHPGFTAAVGMPNPFRGGLGVGTVPGTSARDFSNALESVKRGAFMQAYESLKGSGAISGAEGTAATEALANMQTSTSESQFKTELQRFMNIVANGVKVARQQSRMGASPYTYDQLMAEKQRRAAAKGGK